MNKRQIKNIILSIMPFILAIIVFIVSLIIIRNNDLYWWLKIIIIVSSFLISIIFNVFFHELGHMIYGLFSHYKFLQFRILNLLFYKDNNKVKLKFERLQPMILGQCIMVPPKYKKNKKTPFALYNAGGLIHSYMVLFISTLLFILIPNYYVKYAMIPLITVTLYFCLSNSIYIEGGINDVCNYIAVKKDPQKLNSLCYQLEVTANLLKEKKYGAKISYPLYVPKTFDNITFPPILFRFYYALDHHDLELAKKYMDIIKEKYYSIGYLTHQMLAVLEMMYADIVIYKDKNRFKRDFEKIDKRLLLVIRRLKGDLLAFYNLYEKIYNNDYNLSDDILELRNIETFKGDSLSLNNRLDYLEEALEEFEKM